MAEMFASLTATGWKFEDALKETEKVIQKHSKTFYFATALLPASERRAIRALYAFCRASDDLVDCENTQTEDFERWQFEVALPAHKQSNPMLAAWAYVREHYGIDRRYEQDLLAGMRMDLQFKP